MKIILVNRDQNKVMNNSKSFMGNKTLLIFNRKLEEPTVGSPTLRRE